MIVNLSEYWIRVLLKFAVSVGVPPQLIHITSLLCKISFEVLTLLLPRLIYQIEFSFWKTFSCHMDIQIHDSITLRNCKIKFTVAYLIIDVCFTLLDQEHFGSLKHPKYP